MRTDSCATRRRRRGSGTDAGTVRKFAIGDRVVHREYGVGCVVQEGLILSFVPAKGIQPGADPGSWYVLMHQDGSFISVPEESLAPLAARR